MNAILIDKNCLIAMLPAPPTFCNHRSTTQKYTVCHCLPDIAAVVISQQRNYKLFIV